MGKLPADTRGAARALQDFIRLYPRSLLADDALEQFSQLAFAAGRQEEGRRWLGRILSDHPRGDRAAPVRLRLAQLEYGRDKRRAARALLEPLDLARLSLSEQRAALRLRIALARTPWNASRASRRSASSSSPRSTMGRTRHPWAGSARVWRRSTPT